MKASNSIKINAVVTVLVILGVCSPAATEASGWVITQLSDNSYDDRIPQISGSNVVWYGYDGSDGEIFFYDSVNMSEPCQVTDNSYDDEGPEISGSKVVWIAEVDTNDWEIFFWDADIGGDPCQVTDSGYNTALVQISGSKVVWEGCSSAYMDDSEIFFWDADVGGDPCRVTDNSYFDLGPQISGSKVVWIGSDGSDSEIFFWDADIGGEPCQVTDNSYYDEGPQISGSKVVWDVSDGNDREIFFWDADIGGEPCQVTDNNYDDYVPQISGSNVVWLCWDGNDVEVFFWDGNTAAPINITQVTDNNYEDYASQISGSKVVWNTDEGGGNFRIFFWDADICGDPCQVTGNSHSDGLPQISGSNVVWDGNDGSDYEIFLAMPGTIIYVDDDAANDPCHGNPEFSDPSEDGSSAHPFDAIQEAVNAAIDGITVIVANGTYSGTGNRDIDPNGKAITIRSENGPGNCIIDCNGSSLEPHRGFHLHSGEDANSVIEGFTIRNGYADQGGGMYDMNSSPTVTNCTFSGNSANYVGGGIFNYSSSSPTVTNCTFSGNSAGWYGGGMYSKFDSSPTVTNCTFSGNSANYVGGGMYNYLSCSPTVTNCTFSGNSAYYSGGMHNDSNSSPTVTNCAFSGNSAAGYGGGMHNDSNSSPTVTNCTFSGNTADVNAGGGMYNAESSPTLTNCTFSGNSAVSYGGGMYNDSNSSPIVANCILWGNTALSDGNEIALVNSSTIDVNYCDIQGGQAEVYDPCGGLVWGVGNIDADPMFFDANNPDPNLRDYHLRPGSPCIDAGDNNSIPADTVDLDGDGNTTEPIPFDIDDDPRFNDGDSNGTAIVDMGSDEVIWDGAENISPEDEPVTLNPGGGSNDPNEEALVVFDNNSVGDANITVVEMSSDPHPPTGGFEGLGTTLRIETSLADGEFFMTVMIPFDANDLAGKDPCNVDLMYYDASSKRRKLAVAGNDQNSPGYDKPVGDRFETLPISDELGDYGVYWNAGTETGYVWANVDHSTDFGSVVWLRGDIEPDGDVDFEDFAYFATHWRDTGCGICDRADLTGDGNVGWDDLREFSDNWLVGL